MSTNKIKIFAQKVRLLLMDGVKQRLLGDLRKIKRAQKSSQLPSLQIEFDLDYSVSLNYVKFDGLWQ